MNYAQKLGFNSSPRSNERSPRSQMSITETINTNELNAEMISRNLDQSALSPATENTMVKHTHASSIQDPLHLITEPVEEVKRMSTKQNPFLSHRDSI